MNRQLGIREIDALLAAADDALRQTDPSAFTVLPRVLRRVIRHHLELPGLLTRIPHRDSYVVSADRLRQVVSPDELSHDVARTLPERVILLSRPEENELESLTRGDLLLRYWRLLFHARVHLAIEERSAAGFLTAATVRQRIDRIGQVAFDEIETVLRQENLLLPASGRKYTYGEFVARYLEFRHFRPDLIPVFYPSLRDLGRIDSVIAEDVDAQSLFQATRLPEAPSPEQQPLPGTAPDVAAGRRAAEERFTPGSAISAKTRLAMLRRAERAGDRGNCVRSAITRWRAARSASSEIADELRKSADLELDRLSYRLAKALGHDEDRRAAWRRVLVALLPRSAIGFWNANARLLYDLQKVCLAHERETYVVDVLTWVRTLGRRPLRRPLPNQREVLMSRHLRTASARLKNADLSPQDRETLAELLHSAMQAAERRLRDRLRPIIEQSLHDVQLRPDNRVEAIASGKIVEELLDGIVQRGFLNLGDLRDAVSRSTLKMADLEGASEVLRGDALLRADRELSVTLDGVYQRAAFYLRWLQRLSSVAFGTEFGRALVLYAILPFGGAFLIISAVEHLLFGHSATDPMLVDETVTLAQPMMQSALFKAGWVICIGSLLLGLLHVPWFRDAVWGFVRATGRLLRRLFIVLPRRLMELAIVREVMRSAPVVLFRRHLLTPLLLALFFCWLMPAVGWYRIPSRTTFIIVWLVFVVVLNSRTGRDIEEVVAERVERMWHHIRIHFFVALFDLIMDTFKWILERIERVIYSVDEWLRFKSGESELTLGFKAALGLIWAAATFVIRFCVTLLIEPQVNPIKHFPVVTVSHKVLLPFTSYLAGFLTPVMGPEMAWTVAPTIILVLPGVFGFLVWELRGNWRLYEANRHQLLVPVAVGLHGETMVRLLKPGLHSGTVPKLFGKLRRAARQADPSRRRQTQLKIREKLHHAQEGVERFFKREFLPLFKHVTAWEGINVDVGRVELGTNSVRLQFLRRDSEVTSPAWFTFAEQSGWMVAGDIEPGWIAELAPAQRKVFETAVVGLYQLSGVDLVREQMESCFAPKVYPYDITEEGIVVWPGEQYKVEALYDLEDRPSIEPVPQAVADGFGLSAIDAERLIFGLSSISWDEWVAAWEDVGHDARPGLFSHVEVLGNPTERGADLVRRRIAAAAPPV